MPNIPKNACGIELAVVCGYKECAYTVSVCVFVRGSV